MVRPWLVDMHDMSPIYQPFKKLRTAPGVVEGARGDSSHVYSDIDACLAQFLVQTGKKINAIFKSLVPAPGVVEGVEVLAGHADS